MAERRRYNLRNMGEQVHIPVDIHVSDDGDFVQNLIGGTEHDRSFESDEGSDKVV